MAIKFRATIYRYVFNLEGNFLSTLTPKFVFCNRSRGGGKKSKHNKEKEEKKKEKMKKNNFRTVRALLFFSTP